MRLPKGRCISSTLRTVSHRGRRQGRCVLSACCAIALLILLMPMVSCGNSSTRSEPLQDSPTPGFQMESSAFKQGRAIPRQFTCAGDDISPALRWTAPPPGTRSFVLIVDDPDAPAGVWTHWVVYNLPALVREIPENVPKQDELPGGGLQGLNSFGKVGYGGPCPPPGKAHRYFFHLYALDTMLSLKAGAGKQEVLDAAKGHVRARTELMGRFGR
ncbi:MAG: YbhB/YbcL family Raf kinase inhibitor-like protein [Acidobacteriota bacterium]